MKYSAKDEQSLMTELWDPELADDLYRYVMFVFPWGKAGTPLENFQGPRTWQREELEEITAHIKTQKDRMALGLEPVMWRKARVSGRGPGKSAFVSWLAHHMMTTRLGSTTIVTANNEPQLKSRTFAEITKWNTMAINSHWFDTTVLSVRPTAWFDKALKTQMQIDTGYYYVQGQLWTEENPDAFAGVHNPLGVRLLMDEASGIPQSVFNVSEGFFTEPTLNRFWDVFSNGRRNSGAFFDCFHEHAAFWLKRQIDSRTVEGTDKALFDRMIEQYGIDSDMVRTEVLGQFPNTGSEQFISNGLVEGARTRQIHPDAGAPLILGIDPARFGRDSSVLRWRQGNDARTIPPQKFKGLDNYALADKIAEWIEKTDPDGVCIDAGNGTGVIDILRRRKYVVHEVWFGSDADDKKKWANKRTEMYALLREWLPGAAIDGDNALRRDLTAAEYYFFGKAKDQVMLESKDDMKSRGLPSPDDGDALALTFAKKFARRDGRASRGNPGRNGRVASGVDYSVFG